MITMTYGIMPSKEEFDAAMGRMNALKEFNKPGYRFINDARVGSCTLTPNELWEELNKALTQYNEGDNDKPSEDYYDQDEYDRAEVAGNWVSCVLENLGFEWV